MNHKTISITNLNFRTSIDDIYRAFSRFGTITECRMLLNDRGESKGYAFLGFAENRDATQAIETMNGFHMDGRAIKVGWSTAERATDAKNRTGR